MSEQYDSLPAGPDVGNDTFRVLRWITARLTLALCLSLIALACKPDFTKPGNRGGNTPPDSTIKRGVTHDQSSLPPTAGVCGTTYSARATVRHQLLACANYDYTGLYNRALASANSQIQRVTCPEVCSPRHDYIDHRRWECVNVFNRKIAFATVEVKGICPGPQDPKPPGLAAPAADSLRRAPNDENGPATGPIIVVEEIGDNVAVACPATDNAQFSYAETVPTCRGLNYKPFVDRAEQLAKSHHQSVPCARGCTKAAYKGLNTEWKCVPGASNTNVVQVDVYYAIQCVRSP